MHRVVYALSLLLGCGPSPAAPAPSAWTSVATVSFDADDRSAPFRLVPRSPVTLVRVHLDGACAQWHSLVGDGTETLVAEGNRGPYCVACRWRQAAVVGVGVFVLPTEGAFATLEGRLRLLDCDVLLGAVRPGRRRVTARIEVQDRTPPPQGSVDVQLVRTPSARAAWPEPGPLQSEAAGWFVDAGIALRWAPPCDLSRDLSPDTTLTATEYAPLDALTREADARCPSAGLRVYASGCWRQRDAITGRVDTPPGFTTRIPAGLAPPGVTDGVVLHVGACSPLDRSSPPDPQVLAHELGHALGLFHSVELDGTPDDLDDTTGDDLMNAVPARGARRFSPAQAAAMRRHPLVR